VGALFEALGQLISDFSWRRAGSALLVLVVILLGFVIYESYTAAFRLGRIERTARILSSLAELEESQGLRQDESLSQVYTELTRRLEALAAGTTSGTGIPSHLARILAAFAPWFLVGLGFLWQRSRGDKSAGKALGGVVVMSVPFVIGGALLPQMPNGIINYLAYPWGSFLFFIVVILVLSRASKKRNAAKS